MVVSSTTYVRGYKATNYNKASPPQEGICIDYPPTAPSREFIGKFYCKSLHAADVDGANI